VSEQVREPAKRAAYEPASRLAQPTAYDPDMKRPVSIVAGAVLVLLRVVSGAFVLVTLLLGRTPAEALDQLVDTDLTQQEALYGLTAYAVIVGVGLVVQFVLGILILRGVNFVRVLVMVFSVISIVTAFAGWWWEGQEIRLTGTLLSLSLDILILLALSSRSAAAYTRRKEPRPHA
jgi:hypothetical protein